ncbi:MAG: hypothetical protein SF123_06020 [Chloroflexota bacterium]|nr:hypothetical protein [Chloroflexota bacterium]
MALSGTRTFVGFGFGAIQSGLFLYEAYQSGAFERLVVAEVVPQVVDAVRANAGMFGVNIAHSDRVERAHIGPVTLENPNVDNDRARLIDAIASAYEISTAVPSVVYYQSEGAGSLHRVLAAGLRRKAQAGGPCCVVYTAENNNHAAETLEALVMGEIPLEEQTAVMSIVRFLNTVVGKMSGVPSNAAEIAERGLLPITPDSGRAFLVEAFNRILITRIDFPQPFTRGIQVFQEKDDLLPFEEAKLYGHNATHALLAYIALALGKPLIADLQSVPGVIEFARAAFLEESGAALIQKYMASDVLFTPKGYAAYVDDLIARMVNPHLRDTAERVGRDPARKLGWDDRLIGTMRLAWAHEIDMRRYAFGAAAALAMLPPSPQRVQEQLAALWGDSAPPGAERDAMLKHVAAARVELTSWLNNGTPHLERWWGTSGI